MSELADAMKKLFPDAPIIKIKMLHSKAVRKYVMQIEEGHNRAAKSKLKFRGANP